MRDRQNFDLTQKHSHQSNCLVTLQPQPGAKEHPFKIQYPIAFRNFTLPQFPQTGRWLSGQRGLPRSHLLERETLESYPLTTMCCSAHTYTHMHTHRHTYTNEWMNELVHTGTHAYGLLQYCRYHCLIFLNKYRYSLKKIFLSPSSSLSKCVFVWIYTYIFINLSK